MTPLRFGILGAAHVAPMALVWPAKASADVEVISVAARSPERAVAFAAEHGLQDSSTSYDHLLARDDIDAVYVALPASAHREWAGRALEAGKHVLCEKPLTVDAAEAAELVAIAERYGRVLIEAYHYRYHPFMARIHEVVMSGDLGEVHRIDAVHRNGVPRTWDVYWESALGGGSTLHTGCYPIHCVRTLAGCEPRVLSATAEWCNGVDAAMTAELQLGAGIECTVASSMVFDGRAENWVAVHGSSGMLRATNFIVPHFGEHMPFLRSSLDVRVGGEHIVEHFGGPPTYDFQLAAFVDAVRTGTSALTGGGDAIATMTVIDAMLAVAR